MAARSPSTKAVRGIRRHSIEMSKSGSLWGIVCAPFFIPAVVLARLLVEAHGLGGLLGPEVWCNAVDMPDFGRDDPNPWGVRR